MLQRGAISILLLQRKPHNVGFMVSRPSTLPGDLVSLRGKEMG